MRATILLLIGLLTLAPGALGQDMPRVPDALAESELFRLVKRFDFNERPDGNYEDLPMHWARLEGDGLPFYSDGKFDDREGHDAAPSFQLAVRTGNVAYEYRHFDLTVVPQSDYLVEGHIRTDQLDHSRAFLACFLVDRFQERIPGSERISQLVGGTTNWQRVAIEMPGEFPDAYALRLQVWILKTHVWRAVKPEEVDPIIRQDTHGLAWFDDISVFRLPRARLRFSNPAGLVQPGASESLLVEVNNATPQQLRGEVELHSMEEGLIHRQPLVVPGTVTIEEEQRVEPGDDAVLLTAGRWDELRQVRLPLPKLGPGLYQAILRLRGENEPLLLRQTQFAVLPRLTLPPQAHPDLGVDIGPWRTSNLSGAIEAVKSLGVGAIQVGIPMVGALNSGEKQSYFTQISELVRRLGELRVETVGVMLSQSAGLNLQTGTPTVEQLETPRRWESLASPILAHFGGLIGTWQLGNEQLELHARSQWDADKLATVLTQVRQFITLPNLVVPRRVSEEDAPNDMLVSRWMSPEIPARDFPRMLEFLLEPRDRHRWVRLDWPSEPALTMQQIADRARRMLLAKALGPDRLHLPAPFILDATGGTPAWQPTADFIWLRTFCHYLAGKRAIAAMHPRDEVVAIVFDSPSSTSCMAIWSWRDDDTEPVELYLGENPRAFDPFGREVPLTVTDGRTRVPVSPMPLLVESLQTPLVVLHASYSVRPRRVQTHTSDPTPMLRFKNPYDTVMTGEVNLLTPPNWLLEPDTINFSLGPGEWLEQPLRFTLPPRQLATHYDLQVELILREPYANVLRFDQELEVGLDQIALESTAYWKSDQLIVEQTLRNDSEQVVSFNAFCEPPGRGRYEGAFLNVPPGVAMTTTYVFPKARDLAGATLHHGIAEIAGDRRLDKVVEVPN